MPVWPEYNGFPRIQWAGDRGRLDEPVAPPHCNLSLMFLDAIHAGFQRRDVSIEDKIAGQIARQGDNGAEALALPDVLYLDVAQSMRTGGRAALERAEMRCMAHGGKSRRARLDAGDQREQVIDGVRGPCVRVRTRV